MAAALWLNMNGRLRVEVAGRDDDMRAFLIDADAIQFGDQPAGFLPGAAADALDGAPLEHAAFAAEQADRQVAVGAVAVAFVIDGDLMHDGHQISSQPIVSVSLGVMPPEAVVPTVSIITRWSPFSP